MSVLERTFFPSEGMGHKEMRRKSPERYKLREGVCRTCILTMGEGEEGKKSETTFHIPSTTLLDP